MASIVTMVWVRVRVRVRISTIVAMGTIVAIVLIGTNSTIWDPLAPLLPLTPLVPMDQVIVTIK